MSTGFIIVRHVNSKETNEYWKESYKCIRKYYDNPILIVDDYSNKQFLEEDIDTVNCTTVYNYKYIGAGEILGYYYFYTLRPFDKAVIIHDSVFVNSKINFDMYNDIKFLWDFTDVVAWRIEDDITKLITSSSNSDILTVTYKHMNPFYGCFGIMSVITWEFLHKLNGVYSLFDRVLMEINSRPMRCAMERVFAIMCKSLTQPITQNACSSVFGDIHSYMPWGSTFKDYKNGKLNSYPFIKVWTGR